MSLYLLINKNNTSKFPIFKHERNNFQINFNLESKNDKIALFVVIFRANIFILEYYSLISTLINNKKMNLISFNNNHNNNNRF